jgi:predicted ATPase
MDSSANSQTRFGNLSIRGFRRLQNVQFPLRPLCVMIGANGTGKTSVLDVMSLLANSARGKLSASITDLSGLPSVLTYDRTDDLCLGISMEVPRYQPLEYSLKLKPQSVAYVIEEETLTQKQRPQPPPFLHIDSHITRWSKEIWSVRIGSTIPLKRHWPKCRKCFKNQKIFATDCPLQPFTTC